MVERGIAARAHSIADGFQVVWVAATEIEAAVAIFVVNLGEHC
jgi:hypothetical protein